MKLRSNLFAFMCAIVIYTSPIIAQTYNTAIGIRVDDGINLTVKQFLTNRDYLEAMVHTPMLSKDVGATLLWERHRKLITRNTSIYYGAGAHAYLRNQGRQVNQEVYKNVIGVSGIAGFDLCIKRLNLSVDILPELHLTGETTRAIDWNGVSISARYIIDQKERTKLRDRVKVPEKWKRDKQDKKRKDTGRRRN